MAVFATAAVHAQTVARTPATQAAINYFALPEAKARGAQVKCPDPEKGSQPMTFDTVGCWSPMTYSAPFDGSWLQLRITPSYARVYVNGSFAGYEQQFETPYRGVRLGLGPQYIEVWAPGYQRQSFWMSQDADKISTLSGDLRPAGKNAAGNANAVAQARGGNPVQPIQQIKPGLYVVAGAGANSEVRVTADGVILVDTKLPGEQNYNALLEQIRSVTDKPVKLVIVTHHHADHTGNVDRFEAAGVPVLGHANLAANAATYNNNPKPAPPNRTYQGDRSTTTLGGVTVEARHFGRSHTSGDSIVYFPDLKVVAVSDAVTTGGQGPLIDYAGGGSALEWKHVFEELLKLDFDAAVPGNGPVLTKADIQAYAAKFNTVIDRLTALVKAGTPKEEILKQLKTDDIGWAPRVPQIDGLYAELSASR